MYTSVCVCFLWLAWTMFILTACHPWIVQLQRSAVRHKKGRAPRRVIPEPTVESFAVIFSAFFKATFSLQPLLSWDAFENVRKLIFLIFQAVSLLPEDMEVSSTFSPRLSTIDSPPFPLFPSAVFLVKGEYLTLSLIVAIHPRADPCRVSFPF